MNPLRHDISSNSEIFANSKEVLRGGAFPRSLSLTTLNTEIRAIPAAPAQTAPEAALTQVRDNPEQATGVPVDPEDFWAAWNTHKEYLFRLSMIWMNISAADAEDAFADATIRAYEKYAAHAAQISNERAWFARLLHNICIDRHRANRRLGNLYDKVKEISEIEFAMLETRQLTPEGRLLNRELGGRLHAAITELPKRLRAPVILRLVQGEEYDDIAQRLGISNDNVRKRVQQGRAILRDKLAVFRE